MTVSDAGSMPSPWASWGPGYTEVREDAWVWFMDVQLNLRPKGVVQERINIGCLSLLIL